MISEAPHIRFAANSIENGCDVTCKSPITAAIRCSPSSSVHVIRNAIDTCQTTMISCCDCCQVMQHKEQNTAHSSRPYHDVQLLGLWPGLRCEGSCATIDTCKSLQYAVLQTVWTNNCAAASCIVRQAGQDFVLLLEPSLLPETLKFSAGTHAHGAHLPTPSLGGWEKVW